MDTEVCICELDADGHCAKCQKTMGDAIRKVGESLLEYQEKIKGSVAGFGDARCGGCAARYADWAIARHMETIGKLDTPKEFIDATFKTITRLFMGLGVAAFPLTLKAYKEVCWARGWPEDDLFEV